MGQCLWHSSREKLYGGLDLRLFNFIDHDPNYGARTISQSPICTTEQPIQPDADPKTPGPTVKLILKTIPPTITGLKPHLRYTVPDTKRQEPVDRSRLK